MANLHGSRIFSLLGNNNCYNLTNFSPFCFRTISLMKRRKVFVNVGQGSGRATLLKGQLVTLPHPGHTVISWRKLSLLALLFQKSAPSLYLRLPPTILSQIASHQGPFLTYIFTKKFFGRLTSGDHHQRWSSKKSSLKRQVIMWRLERLNATVAKCFFDREIA